MPMAKILGSSCDTMTMVVPRLSLSSRMRSSSRRDEIGSMSDALIDHNTIIDALQARNAAAAVRASAKHVRKSRTKVMRGLENRPVVA